ncbi:MAG TPA: ABC transporter substrate-binding protein [Acidobacteriaceae bacterium]|nr:ABC transporter substrate-binding protein [Acidobacteriaceae bacterium]
MLISGMGKELLRRCGLLCLVLAVLPAGCHRPSAKDGLIHITFQTDWYPQPEHGGFYEALLKGYYRQAGLDVTILPGGPYNNAEQQVATGAAQFGMSSSDRILEADSQGENLVAIGATMQSDPQAIMVHADSPVHSFADLEGKTIAVKPGSTWFEYLRKRYHYKDLHEIPATYSVANFLADPNYIQQVFVTSEPFYVQQAGKKERTLLISATGYSPYRVFFTSSSYLREHPDVVEKFARASIRGWRDYMQDPSLVNAQLMKLNPAQQSAEMKFTWEALKSGHFVDGGNPAQLGAMTDARWAQMYDQLKDLGLIQHPFAPSTAYTLKYCNAQ